MTTVRSVRAEAYRVPLARPVAFATRAVAAREGWAASVGMAALCWAFVYGIFDRLLRVPLPAGELLRLLGFS